MGHYDLIDIGVNLTDKSFRSDVDAVIQHAASVGVNRLVVTGTTVKESIEAVGLAERYPGQVYTTAGVHPHYVKHCDDYSLQQLRDLAAHQSVVAIGECGLDFNRNLSPQNTQIDWFEQQLNLAIELNMPIFLHQRDAHDAFMEVLKHKHAQMAAGVVVHCFTGTVAEVLDYNELDLYIGVTGWVCDERRGQSLQEAVKHIPLNRLMIETDAPYLLPRDLKPKPKSRRNVPSHLPHICESVARFMGKPVQEVAEQSTLSAKRFFNLP